MRITESQQPPESSFYVTGGTLGTNAPSYVSRHADSELFDSLKNGEFCYVLTSRQMGKSSLMVHTAARLRGEGYTVVVLDLTAIGRNVSPEQWYGGLLVEIGRQLNLEDELEDFWADRSRMGPLQRCMVAIREVALPSALGHHLSSPGRLIIFVDEVDFIQSLPFPADEFLAAIRQCYNSRSDNPSLHYLAFCLIGVATPSELISDPSMTPFNIGRRIDLVDFTEGDASTLTRGFECKNEEGKVLLRQVLHWTGGHPYLTQRLCQALSQRIKEQGKRMRMDRLCEELFFSPSAQDRDNNLVFVRERMLKSGVDTASLLGLYLRIFKGRKRVQDDKSPLISALKLSGLVRAVGENLQVRNRIYAHVFNARWALSNMPDAARIREKKAYWRGVLQTTAVYGLIVILIGNLAVRSILEARRSHEQEMRIRQILYVADMDRAQHAWDEGNPDRTLELLDKERPQPGEPDLRGFEWRLLRKICGPSNLLTLPTAKDNISFVAFSPDSQTLASVGGTSTITLWNVISGQKVVGLTRAGDLIVSAAFSPDRRLLAAGLSQGDIDLWDIPSRRCIATLKGHKEAILSIVFSPDGSLLVTGSRDHTARLWNVATQREMAVLRGHTSSVHCVAFSPDGKAVATASDDHTARIWAVPSGYPLSVLEGHQAGVWAVAFSPDGKTLATGSLDGAARLWTVAGHPLAALNGQDGAVHSVAFSQGGRELVTSNYHGIRIWDLGVKRQVTAIHRPGSLSILKRSTLSHDGRILAVLNLDHTVDLWDMSGRNQAIVLRGHEGPVLSLAFSKAPFLAAGGQEGSIQLWDPLKQRLRLTLKGHRQAVKTLAFSPDGRTLASGSADSTIRLWDAAAGREVNCLRGHTGAVNGVAFSPDGRSLATVSEDHTTRLWNVGTGQLEETFAGNGTAPVYAVAFSPDGKILASGGFNSKITLWDTASWNQKSHLPGDGTDHVRCLAFSPDSMILASGDSAGLIRLWDVSAGRVLETLNGHGGDIRSIAFTPDSKTLAVAGERLILLWNVATGQEVGHLNGDSQPINNLAFSLDGNTLAAGSEDQAIRLWNAASPAESDSDNRQPST